MNEQSNPQAVRLANNLSQWGRVWATYGLNLGQAALQSSAKTLQTTAELLGTVSDKLTEEPAEEQEPEVKPEA